VGAISVDDMGLFEVKHAPDRLSGTLRRSSSLPSTITKMCWNSRGFLEAFGDIVLTASGSGKGLEVAAIHSVDVAIPDRFMPAMNRPEVAMELRRLRPQAPIIVLTEGRGAPEPALNLVEAVVAKDRLGQPGVAHDRLLARKRTDPAAPVRRVIEDLSMGCVTRKDCAAEVGRSAVELA